jgi:hypothetical protein
MPTTQEDRAAYIGGLRVLATVLELHPEVPLPYEGDLGEINWFLGNDRDQVAAIARAIPCTWDKRIWGKEDEHFELKGCLAGGLTLSLNANRAAVCTRRVVGTEDREVEEVVTPAVKRTVVKPVEIVEWDCGSLLRPADAGVCNTGGCGRTAGHSGDCEPATAGAVT